MDNKLNHYAMTLDRKEHGTVTTAIECTAEQFEVIMNIIDDLLDNLGWDMFYAAK